MLNLDLGKAGGEWEKLTFTCPDGQVATIHVRSTNPNKIRLSIDAPHEIGIERIKPISKVADRLYASIVAGAVGDGFGFPIEAQKIDTIIRQYGDQGLTEPIVKNDLLVVSDDTQMTLFTWEAVNDCKPDDTVEVISERIRQAYLDWFETQKVNPSEGMGQIWKFQQLHRTRAPGHTCVSALKEGGKGTFKYKINDSKGCGTTMRVAPVGLCGKWDAEKTFEIGMRSAAITHGHDTGILSAAFLAVLLRYLMDDMDLMEAINNAKKLLIKHDNHEETFDKINQALAMASFQSESVSTIEKIGGGWVAEEALGIALYCVLKADNFIECIQMAVNHSGDSDSTAATAGNIWGAAYGADGIPEEWGEALDVLPVIKALV